MCNNGCRCVTTATHSLFAEMMFAMRWDHHDLQFQSKKFGELRINHNDGCFWPKR